MNFTKSYYFLPVLLGILLTSCSSGPKVMIHYQGSSPSPLVNSASEKMDDAKTSSEPSDEVTTVVIISFPEPEGGNRALRKKISYPKKALENGIEGRVSIQFFINENGKTSDFKVIEGIGYGCDEAVIKAIQNTEFEFSSLSEARFLWLVTADFKL